MTRAHDIDENIPVESNVLDTWKEAHPKFNSFSVDQKVALKIQKICRSPKFKLGLKFTGPHRIVKVQSNGVTYELSNRAELTKAHHRQLKSWHNVPECITKCLKPSTVVPNNDHELNIMSDSSSNDFGMNFNVFMLLSDDQSSRCSDLGTSVLRCIDPVNGSCSDYDDVCDRSLEVHDIWITDNILLKSREERDRAILPAYEIFFNDSEVSNSALESVLNLSFNNVADEDVIENNCKMSAPMFVIHRNYIDLHTEVSTISKDTQSQSKASSESALLQQSFFYVARAIPKRTIGAHL